MNFIYCISCTLRFHCWFLSIKTIIISLLVVLILGNLLLSLFRILIDVTVSGRAWECSIESGLLLALIRGVFYFVFRRHLVILWAFNFYIMDVVDPQLRVVLWFFTLYLGLSSWYNRSLNTIVDLGYALCIYFSLPCILFSKKPDRLLVVMLLLSWNDSFCVSSTFRDLVLLLLFSEI